MLKQLDTLIGFAVVMSVISLLITIITQTISSLLGLRGKNLADALEAMAHKIDPGIDKQVKGLAKALANKVLTDSAVSDSVLSMSNTLWPDMWKRASAIRPDELLEILEAFAGKTTIPATGPTTVEEAAAKLLQELGKPSPATKDAIAALTAQLPALAAQKGLDIINEFNAATNVALGNLGKWFNSTQDRAKQWFAMHTRIVTVIASIIAAFGLQLDSFKLLNRISSDSELRARLVAGAPALQKQAQEVFDATDPKSLSLHTNILAELNKQYSGITNFLILQTNLASLDDAAHWISNRLATTAFSNRIDAVVDDYTNTAAKFSRKKVDELTKNFGTISEEFSKTGIELIPEPYPKAGQWGWPFSHLLGILASAALLSLGAPFWFNILKSLTNLRPLLAQQIEKKPKSTDTTNPS